MRAGFRIDPVEKLESVTKELQALHKVFSNSPIFGVEYTLEAEVPPLQQLLQPRVEEDTDVVDEQEDNHAVAAYYAESEASKENKVDHVEFNESLGLAMESLQEGVTVDQLWRVL